MNVERIRKDFPVLETGIIYFDSACMTLRPRPVIDAVMDYYMNTPVCSGRSTHRLATELSIKVDDSREAIRRLINAPSDQNIVFTKNTTEALNIAARGLPLVKGDKVLTLDREHNSNLAPWHVLRDEKGIVHDVIASNQDGTFNMENLKEAMTSSVKLLSLGHTSNIIGTSIPAKEIIEIAHDHGALVMLDSAQAVPHKKIDVQNMNVDILAFSVHKMCGPTGVGVMYGKEEVLKKMRPLLAGGGAVAMTTLKDTSFLAPPDKFEAGLQNYAGLSATKAAVEYLESIGMEEVQEHDLSLNKLATQLLKDHVDILGPEDPSLRGGIFNFKTNVMDIHDMSLLLDSKGILTRAGMHCVHSWYDKIGGEGGTRASFYIYNTQEEVRHFAETLLEALE